MQRARTDACLTDILTRREVYERDAEAAHEERQNELLAFNAEKAATSTSQNERQAYIAKQKSQLSVEMAECKATSEKIHGIEVSQQVPASVLRGLVCASVKFLFYLSVQVILRMLSNEIDEYAGIKAHCASTRDDADAAQARAIDALATHRKKSKERITLMRAALLSETEIVSKQSTYVDDLRHK